MHHLNRAIVPAPACLTRYRHGVHHWNDLIRTRAHYEEVWRALDQMQGKLCAYCEGTLRDSDQHVEHFRRRHFHPVLTFAWTNLLGCCGHQDSCGHYKDNGAGPYQIDDLIDPSREDPDHFFRFAGDGTISLRAHLIPAERHRAAETIRVLGLDPDFGRLRDSRRRAVSMYMGRDPSLLDELMGLPDDARREYVRQELASTATDPFCTVIRHLFEGLI